MSFDDFDEGRITDGGHDRLLITTENEVKIANILRFQVILPEDPFSGVLEDNLYESPEFATLDEALQCYRQKLAEGLGGLKIMIWEYHNGQEGTVVGVEYSLATANNSSVAIH